MTTMQLVEQHIIARNDLRWQVIDAAAFAAKNIRDVSDLIGIQAQATGQYLGWI